MDNDNTLSNESAVPEGQQPAEGVEQGGQQADSAGQQPAAGGQQQQQPTWDGNAFALNFRGRTVVPESREKLLNWAQLGYSSNQRSQQLQNQEREIQTRLAAVKEYEQLAEAFKKNPAFKQQVLNWYYQSMGAPQGQPQNRQDQGQGQFDPSVLNPFAEQLSSLQGRLESFERNQADSSLQKEINELTGKYKNVDWNTPDESGRTFLHEVLQNAHQMGGIPLEVAFRHIYWDQAMQNAQAQALSNQNTQRQANAKKGQPIAGAGKPAGAKAQEPMKVGSMSWNEIARAALAETP